MSTPVFSCCWLPALSHCTAASSFLVPAYCVRVPKVLVLAWATLNISCWDESKRQPEEAITPEGCIKIIVFDAAFIQFQLWAALWCIKVFSSNWHLSSTWWLLHAWVSGYVLIPYIFLGLELCLFFSFFCYHTQCSPSFPDLSLKGLSVLPESLKTSAKFCFIQSTESLGTHIHASCVLYSFLCPL